MYGYSSKNNNNIISLNSKGKTVLNFGRRRLESNNLNKSNINCNKEQIEKINSNNNFLYKRKNYQNQMEQNRQGSSSNNERHSIFYSTHITKGFNKIKKNERVPSNPSNMQIDTYYDKISFSNPNLM